MGAGGKSVGFGVVLNLIGFKENYCVTLFFYDHNPPHFKVKYSKYEANVMIEDGDLMNGDLPKRQFKLVQAWAEIHKEELLEMWLCKDFHKIKPLS